MPRELLDDRENLKSESAFPAHRTSGSSSGSASPPMLGRHRATGADLGALQGSAGNRAVLALLDKEGDHASEPPDQAPPLSPPEMAHEAADEGLGHIQEAVITAGAAFLVEHIVGTKHVGKKGWGASQREQVTSALEKAGKLADILAFAATRELQQGTGMYGTADAGTDEHALLRQRARARRKSLDESSKKLRSGLQQAALVEGARRVLKEEQTRWFGPILLEARQKLFTAAEAAVKSGTTDERLAAASKAVAAELPAVTKKTTKEATKSLSGPKNKWVRDQLKDQTAQASVDVLSEAIADETGPGREKAKLTKDTVEATFSSESVGSGLRKIGKLIDSHAKHNGDQTSIAVLLKIPVSHGVFAGLKVTGLASKASDKTSAGATFSFIAGWEAPQLAQGLLEIGGYLNTTSDRGGLGCMEMASYTLYRRAREASFLPRDVASTMWGYGGITAKKGERKSDVEYRESEAWANQIETGMSDDDLGEFGLHGGASGSGNIKGVGKAGGGLAVDTGTRYTKKGIADARARGKGERKNGGAPSSIGQKVTTLSLFGNADFAFGASADAKLAITWDDKAKKVLSVDIDAGVGYTLPATVGGDYAEWTGKAVGKVGSAITKAVNKAKEGDSAKKQVKSAAKNDLKTAGSLAEKFPGLEKEVEAKLTKTDLYQDGKAHVETLGSEAKAKGNALLGQAKQLDPLSQGKKHATSGAKHAKKASKAASKVMDKGFRVFASIDAKSPKESYLAVQQTKSKDTTSGFHEVTVKKNKALLYYDFETKTFEWGGQVVTTGKNE